MYVNYTNTARSITARSKSAKAKCIFGEGWTADVPPHRETSLSRSRSANDDLAFLIGAAAEQFHEPLRQHSGRSGPDGSAIDFNHGDQFAQGARAKHFVGTINFCQRQIAFVKGNAGIPTD